MGYCVAQTEAMFLIKKENFAKALEAIKALGKEREDMPYGFFYSWVDMDGFVNAKDIEDAMKAWRWNVEFDVSGNIEIIEFTGEKLGDDKVLFDAIAPFVEDNSYIEMQGEDGRLWRWFFKNSQCREIYPKIEWEEYIEEKYKEYKECEECEEWLVRGVEDL
jgi:hypothetical protein